MRLPRPLGSLLPPVRQCSLPEIRVAAWGRPRGAPRVCGDAPAAVHKLVQYLASNQTLCVQHGLVGEATECGASCLTANRRESLRVLFTVAQNENEEAWLLHSRSALVSLCGGHLSGDTGRGAGGLAPLRHPTSILRIADARKIVDGFREGDEMGVVVTVEEALLSTLVAAETYFSNSLMTYFSNSSHSSTHSCPSAPIIMI